MALSSRRSSLWNDWAPDRDQITVALGPCIGPAAYEVGIEFEARFLDTDADHARFFHRPADATRPYFDLPAFIEGRCRSAGITCVPGAHACTYTNSGQFFSYRRTTHAREPDYGRQISAIVLTD